MKQSTQEYFNMRILLGIGRINSFQRLPRIMFIHPIDKMLKQVQHNENPFLQSVTK